MKIKVHMIGKRMYVYIYILTLLQRDFTHRSVA